MKKNFEFTTTYCVGGMFYTFKGLKSDHFEITMSEREEIFKVLFTPKTTLSHLEIVMECTHLYSSQTRIFPNGYQSWTDTREFTPDEKLPRIKGLAKLLPGLKPYGDEYFVKYPRTCGVFHGFTYGYTRDMNKVSLFGSMTEKNGYTIITFNTKKNSISITKDLEGKTFNKPFEAFEIGYFEGEYDEVFDRYFSLQNLPPLKIKRATGYTSWYNYYANVHKTDIQQDLESFTKNNISIDLFQIDDGYQTQVGDWLSIKPDFGDMKEVADLIHSKKIKAGLWLAPFACTRKSTVYKQHPEWLLRDSKGKLVSGGLNWGGAFYILDIYKPGVKDYLKNIFDVVLNKWGFDMVKLDFLYAECITPRENKSRGEIMCEALDFIRECVGNKLILGCGVPLGPAFGKVDFCRIGPDVGLKWKESYIEKCMHRERVSVINTLNNTIFRRHLNDRAFVNDPDVFFLRDYNLSLNSNQKTIIADVNKLFGGVLFVSDNISTYSNKTLKTLEDLYKNDEIEIVSAEYITKSLISIEYSINGVSSQEFVFDIESGEIIRD